MEQLQHKQIAKMNAVKLANSIVINSGHKVIIYNIQIKSYNLQSNFFPNTV